MRVLITGATGLVGQAIVKELHLHGHTVNYLTTSKRKIEVKDDYQGFYWNPAKKQIDNNCFEEVDFIINLAGATIAKRWTTAYRQTILNSRIESIQTLRHGLSKINRSQIKGVVTASAVGIYPDSLSSYYDEDNQGVDQSFLGEVVSAWEKEFDKLNIFNFQLAKIRIGLVLSEKGGALPQIVKPVNYLVGAPLGSGEQWQSWIHIDDLAKIFVFVLVNNLEGVFNGVAPNPVTNRKMIKEIGSILKKPVWLPAVPAVVLNFVLGKMAYILLASQRVSSKKIEAEGFEFEFSNIQAALQDLLISNHKKEPVSAMKEREYA